MATIDDRFFDAILGQMEGQDPIFLPSEFWRQALNKIGNQLRNGGVKSFKNLAGPGTFFVPSYELESLRAFPAQLLDSFVEELHGTEALTPKQRALLDQLLQGYHLALADYRAFKAGDQPELPPCLEECSESPIGEPSSQVSFEGRSYSRSMLNYLNGIVFLKQHIETHHLHRVLELGGGYGTLGEILRLDPRRDYLYVDVDIPPTSYAASYYLNELYGKDFISALDVGDDGIIETTHLEAKAMVLSTWQLPRLQGTFDLFVNFISFQEMEPDIVDNYLSHVARLKCRYGLCRNLREGKNVRSTHNPVGVETPITGDTYDQLFGKHGYALVATNVFPFGFKTADGFHSELRLYERRSD
jgi:putative sugar O-methyltransferase